MHMLKIAILGGTGGMGSLFADFWKNAGYEILVLGSDLKDLEKISKCEIIVFAVPKNKFEEILSKVSLFLNKNQIVVSFSSYLGEEKQAVKDLIKEYTFIHAMFGPDILDFKDQNFVVSKTTNKNFQKLLLSLKNSGANILETDSEEHDRMMGYVQALSQFSSLALAHTLRDSDFSERQLNEASSITFRINTDNIKRILKQKAELWWNIQFENKFFLEILQQYKKVVNKMEEILLKKNKNIFEKEFEFSKDFFNARTEEVLIENTTVQKINKKLVAILGPEGTYSHEALKSWDKSRQPYFCDTISDVIKLIKDEKIENAVLPFENSIHGTVVETIDQLSDSDLKIYDEFSIPINHCVGALDSIEKDLVKTVFSHPQALGQCKKYIEVNFPNAKVISTPSTSSGLKKIRDENIKNAVAIGSEFAAKLFGIKVLDRNIQDEENNRTLFVSVSKNRDLPVAPHVLLVLEPQQDKIGSLHDILGIFKDNNINLLKLESRPSRRKLGEYLFYVKLEINSKSSKFDKILKYLDQENIPYSVLTS